MYSQDEKKRAAGEAALQFLHQDSLIGVGTGSTVGYFIEALKELKFQLRGAVSSSSATSRLLRAAGIPEVELNTAGDLDLYIDGADEATRHGALVKGGGGALTREKIVAAASATFVCILDDGKLVDGLGRFPLPVEVIPMARSYVARQMVKLGGQPVWRENIVTDNGNVILDVYHLAMSDPKPWKRRSTELREWLVRGLFAKRGADVLLIGGDTGVQTIKI